MDIAKIRKKAREQGQVKQAEGRTEERPSGLPETVEETCVPAAPEEQEALPDEPAGILSGETSAVPPPAAPVAAEGASGGHGAEEGAGITELLTFSLANEEFAFRVPDVEEIIRVQRITVVPTVAGYVAGITSLRGKIIPVIDLRTRLSLKTGDAAVAARGSVSEEGREEQGKIIILSGPLGLIGAIIDRVIGVVRLPEDFILQPPGHLTEEETKYLEGVVIVDKRFISIIRSEDALNIEVG